MASLDNVMKAKLNNYNLAKGALVQIQRKKTYVLCLLCRLPFVQFRLILTSGNLSVRSLADIVSKDDFLQDSEYMETLLVAVPK